MTLPYCLVLCDEIFDHFPLFDKTLRVTYSEIFQNFSNSVGRKNILLNGFFFEEEYEQASVNDNDVISGLQCRLFSSTKLISRRRRRRKEDRPNENNPPIKEPVFISKQNAL